MSGDYPDRPACQDQLVREETPDLWEIQAVSDLWVQWDHLDGTEIRYDLLICDSIVLAGEILAIDVSCDYY